MELNIDSEEVQVALALKKLKSDEDETTDHPERSTIPPTVHDLPPELLMELFTWFSVRELCETIAPVCKIWHLSSKNKSLWKHLSFEGDENVTTEQLCSLLSHATQLQSLRLVDRVDTDAVLQQVAISNQSLQILKVKLCRGSLQDFRIQEEVVLNVINSCSKLVEITIKRNDFYSDKIFQVIPAALPYLKRINFNFTSDFGSRSLNIIICNCKPLEELCVNWQSNGFRPLSSYESEINDNDIYELCTRMKNSLMVLKIFALELTNSSIESIAQCTCLQTLGIDYATRLSDDGILLLNTLRHLSSLNVQCADGVTSEGWQELFITSEWASMRKLSLIRCIGVDDNLLEVIGKTYPYLQSICLRSCTHVTVDGLSKLIKGCNHLLFLSVERTHIKIYKCFPLIPTHTPNLRRLVAYETDIVASKVMLKVIKQTLCDIQSKLPNLQILSSITPWGDY